MAKSLFLIFALALSLVSAHFDVDYPYWRGDSFSTQYTRPCGGVNVTNNRTDWPLDGGSLLFNPTHHWAITYVNLGLGQDDAIVFNISLVEGFNQTGNGTFCFPKIQIPEGLPISAGTNASLQVIQLGELGSALYNCADITFTDDAQLLSSDECSNSTGISWQPIGSTATSDSEPSGTGSPSSTASPKGAAPRLAENVLGTGLLAVLVALVSHIAL
ncbi:hypothetical protein FQN57_006085 [Myotisia sp. PD_48]|nr:hypothetical protein FQN57_006085 [Myotisia sp. PD_48]